MGRAQRLGQDRWARPIGGLTHGDHGSVLHQTPLKNKPFTKTPNPFLSQTEPLTFPKSSLEDTLRRRVKFNGDMVMVRMKPE